LAKVAIEMMTKPMVASFRILMDFVLSAKVRNEAQPKAQGKSHAPNPKLASI
jgi:hypothetical protein